MTVTDLNLAVSETEVNIFFHNSPDTLRIFFTQNIKLEIIKKEDFLLSIISCNLFSTKKIKLVLIFHFFFQNKYLKNYLQNLVVESLFIVKSFN